MFGYDPWLNCYAREIGRQDLATTMSQHPPPQVRVDYTIKDPYGAFNNEEFCGTFGTLPAANKAACTALLKDLTRDDFEEWEETVNEQGRVHICATFPKGEVAEVWVTEVCSGAELQSRDIDGTGSERVNGQRAVRSRVLYNLRFKVIHKLVLYLRTRT